MSTPDEVLAALHALESRLHGLEQQVQTLVNLVERNEAQLHGVLATGGTKMWLRLLAAAELSRRSGDSSLAGSELKVFSQNGEDGVLQSILATIGAGEGYFVEFGAANGMEGNCVYLADVAGWSGAFIEADPVLYERLESKYANNVRVRTLQAEVRADNVEEVFRDAGVPTEPTVLSIDIDGGDYWVWRSIQSFRPAVVIIEYNSGLPAEARLVQPPDWGAWEGNDFFGASLGALVDLGTAKGYDLAHLESTGTNAFFVRSGLGRWDSPVPRSPNYLLEGYRHGPAATRPYVTPAPPEN